ncbi:MAG TPA: Rieske 2Fe-2S domain-containing protein [Alphaproteobacteria bacterium]|jgi:5,5'-dehydrodivanillate O-demethylase
MNAAHKPEDYRDYAHIGPDTLGGKLLRRFWQPIMKSNTLEIGRPKRVEILGEFFTAYRGDDGKAYVVQDACPHRMTRLSLGWVEEDAIRCFYHGWKFKGGNGQCVHQPAEPAAYKDKIKVKAYPVHEYVGLVFVYFGEGEAPPFPAYPEIDLEKDTVFSRSHAVPSNFFQRLENDLDEVHLHFVHRVSTDHVGLDQLPEISVEECDYGILRKGTREDEENNINRTGHIFMPNSMMVFTPPRPARMTWVLHLAWRVPVNDTSMISFVINANKGEAGGYKEWTFQNDPHPDVYVDKILGGEMRVQEVDPKYPALFQVQDSVAMSGQGTIVDRSAERLGLSDRGIILLRRLWAREMQAIAEGRPLKDWKRPKESLLDLNSREVQLADHS